MKHSAYYAYLQEKPKISFSKQGGFYDETVTLEIISGGGYDRIYYTLDGSIPSKKSIAYTEPIVLKNVSENDNIWADREDIYEYGFFRDETPKYKVDKANIIRAIAYNKMGKSSEVITATYFIGLDSNKYSNMPIVSLISEPDHLFGYENGIYIKGASEINVESLETEKMAPSAWPANYNKKGKEWERPVYMEFYSKEKKLEFTQNIGVRIGGGYTRGYAQKNFKLYARTEYDGNNFFSYDFFNTGRCEAVLNMSAGGNDRRAKLKDALVHYMTENLTFATANTMPCVLFLNGEYWGVYWLSERMDEYYISRRYGIPLSNLVVIKNGKLYNGSEKDYSEYKELLHFINTADFTQDENYQKLKSMIDIQNYIDYCCMNIYINNTDWIPNNTMLWKCREMGQGKCEDTRWRYIAFDMNNNSCMDEEYVQVNLIEQVMNKECAEEWLSKCMENEEFRDQFYKTFIKMGTTNFKAERVNAKIDAIANEMMQVMLEDYRRFPNRYTRETDYATEVLSIQNFYKKRKEYIDNYVQEVLYMYGESAYRGLN